MLVSWISNLVTFFVLIFVSGLERGVFFRVFRVGMNVFFIIFWLVLSKKYYNIVKFGFSKYVYKEFIFIVKLVFF